MAALAALLLVPFDLTIAPERRFKVVDENGTPIKRAQAIQTWYQYSLGFRDEEIRSTDFDGLMLFRRRGIQTSMYTLVRGAMVTVAEYTIHASICSTDFIIVDAFGYKSEYYSDGKDLGDIVVLKNE
jgi:hypothetical protein